MSRRTRKIRSGADSIEIDIKPNEIRIDTPSLLSSSEPRQFWASVVAGNVRVGTGAVVGSNVFLQWQDPDPYSALPANIGLMTCCGATGLWHVCRMGRHVWAEWGDTCAQNG